MTACATFYSGAPGLRQLADKSYPRKKMAQAGIFWAGFPHFV